jgi:hypothetical protein
MFCPISIHYFADFDPYFQHEKKVYIKKYVLYHEKELLIRFSKHPQLLLIGVIKHEWHSFAVEVIFQLFFNILPQNIEYFIIIY